MDPRWQWRLEDIFETQEAFETAFAQAKAQIEELPKWQGHVAENPRAAIEKYFALSELVERLYSYATMRKDEDGSDPGARAGRPSWKA